jgi:MFS family permease
MTTLAALTFCLISFLKDAWTFWALSLTANFVFGSAETLILIVPTSIIYSEFPKKANLYLALLTCAWAGGFLLGPLISFMAYDTIGYAGMFLLIAGL